MTEKLQSQLDDQRRRVDVEHFDLTVRELVRMASTHEIIRAPDYQRHFRWKEDAESRLIESILLGLPVPPIYVAANPDGKWELVDGLQRLSSLMHFVADPPSVLSDIDRKSPLRLDSLATLTEINRLPFSGLPTSLQLSFLKRFVRVTVLSDKSDKHVRFELFDRLNRGAIALSPQEVRACVFRGDFANFLRELAKITAFEELLKLQEAHQRDGTAEEQVLKFFAYLRSRNAFKGNVRQFLDSYMEQSSQDFDFQSARKLFSDTCHALRAVIGGALLRSSYHVTPLNQFEAVLVATAEILEAKTQIAPQEGWLEDAELVAHSTRATNTRASLAGRLKRARDLLEGAAVKRPQ